MAIGRALLKRLLTLEPGDLYTVYLYTESGTVFKSALLFRGDLARWYIEEGVLYTETELRVRLDKIIAFDIMSNRSNPATTTRTKGPEVFAY